MFKCTYYYYVNERSWLSSIRIYYYNRYVVQQYCCSVLPPRTNEDDSTEPMRFSVVIKTETGHISAEFYIHYTVETYYIFDLRGTCAGYNIIYCYNVRRITRVTTTNRPRLFGLLRYKTIILELYMHRYIIYVTPEKIK